MVFENRVLRRTYGPMNENITGGQSKEHTEELHNAYSSQKTIRPIKSDYEKDGHVASMER
jgi:hypothetical protein